MSRECVTHHHACDCREARARAIESAARKLFTVKGRYHSQIAMCELGELLGYPVVWPNKKEQEVE